MIYITRKERFNAAHRVFRPDWTDEKNLQIFGKCSNPNWHGHNYDLFVTIKGEVNPETGYLIDLKVLSSLIREKIVNKIDHSNINLDVDFMQGQIATTENLAMSVWKELDDGIKLLGAELHCIKLYESENNVVEYFG